MAVSIFVVVGWIYLKTGSLRASLTWLLLSALLLQIGYFIVLLAMIFGLRISRIYSPFSLRVDAEHSPTDGEALPKKAKRNYLPIVPKSQDTPDLDR